MYSLAVDTATTQGSLALFKDKSLIDQCLWEKTGSHSEFITQQFVRLLKKHSLNANAIKRVAVNIGPGSFTGIRVGINFARALGYTLKVPIFAANSLELLALFFSQSCEKSCDFFVAQYAFRDLFYVAGYRFTQPDKNTSTLSFSSRKTLVEVQSPAALTAQNFCEALKVPTVVLGTGLKYINEYVEESSTKNIVAAKDIRTDSLATDFAFTSFLDEKPALLTSWIHTIPLYIRASEAEEKLKLGHIKTHY